MRKESEEWIKSLTSQEKKAIRKYTYNSGDKKPNRFFERLNAMLRGENPEDSKLKAYADTISNALKRNSLSEDVICYRSLDVNPIGNREAGSVVRLKQFISTSVIESRAFNDKVKMIIYVKKGSKAAYIESLSKYPSQRELLLDKDCIYRVISNKENVVELEVI